MNDTYTQLRYSIVECPRHPEGPDVDLKEWTFGGDTGKYRHFHSVEEARYWCKEKGYDLENL